MRLVRVFLVIMMIMFAVANGRAAADDTPPAEGDTFLLTIFLKHDQSKPLEQLQAELDETGFWAKFPPEGIEVASWYVMMGVGQVVTLNVPAHRLREVNLAIEKTAWGPFRTEFYPTYDLSPIAADLRAKKISKDEG